MVESDGPGEFKDTLTWKEPDPSNHPGRCVKDPRRSPGGLKCEGRYRMSVIYLDDLQHGYAGAETVSMTMGRRYVPPKRF